LKVFLSHILVQNLKDENLVYVDNTENLGLVLGLVFGMVTILLVSFIVVYKIRRNTQSVLTREDIEEFLNETKSMHENNQAAASSLIYACLPYNKNKEVESKDYTIG